MRGFSLRRLCSFFSFFFGCALLASVEAKESAVLEDHLTRIRISYRKPSSSWCKPYVSEPRDEEQISLSITDMHENCMRSLLSNNDPEHDPICVLRICLWSGWGSHNAKLWVDLAKLIWNLKSDWIDLTQIRTNNQNWWTNNDSKSRNEPTHNRTGYMWFDSNWTVLELNQRKYNPT